MSTSKRAGGSRPCDAVILHDYRGLKIYLDLAALSFEDDVVEEAKKYGVGLLQQVGDTVEYAVDWEMKAY